MLTFRCIFEVVRLLPAEDVLQSASLVCHPWHQAAVSDQLWESLLSDRNVPVTSPSSERPADRFRRAACRRKDLAVLSREGLCVFDCCQERWRDVIPIPREVTANEWSAFAFLQDASLICTGGNKGDPEDPKKLCSSRTFRISAAATTRLRDMKSSRERHGIIVFRGDVYVFGGRNLSEPLRSCECLRTAQGAESMSTLNWEELPDMFSSRYAFNPCADDKFIYLCGGVTNAAESFYPDTMTFAPLNFKLPDEAFSHSALLVDSELLILSRLNVTKWSVKKRKLEVTRHKGLRGNVSSYMNGLVHRNCVYKPSIGLLRKFSFATLSETEIEVRLIPSPT